MLDKVIRGTSISYGEVGHGPLVLSGPSSWKGVQLKEMQEEERE